MARSPILYMLAGPNGAGKSTLYKNAIQPYVNAPFINADIIQRDELKDVSVTASYRAAEIAEDRRQQALVNKTDFVSESTFSHPSKLALIDDAKAAGFKVVLYHVNLRSPNLSVSRVEMRFKNGGHDVPEAKVRERFERNKPLIKQAVLLADRAFVYDNSQFGRPPACCISFKHGKVIEVGENVPAWARELYAKELEPFSQSKLNPAAASFQEAKRIVGHLAGDAATMRIPDVKGNAAYVGPMVGESAMHLVQRIGDSGFIAHFKSNLPAGVKLHQPVLVQYKGVSPTVKRLDPQVILNSKQSEALPPEKREELKRLLGVSGHAVQPVRVAPAIPEKVEILFPVGALKAHPEYHGAKNGDAQMAMALIDRIVTHEAVQAIAAKVRETEATLLPVVGSEDYGGNLIPVTFAAAVAGMTGVPVNEGVIRKTPDHRTNQDGIDRIFNTPIFEGKVKPGDRFYLIDDTITQGGTLAALSRYIVENGGQVVGATVLTGQQRSATLAITENTLVSVRKHFQEIEHDFKKLSGRDFSALTESEGRYITQANLVQRFRDETAARNAAARLETSAGVGESKGTQGQSRQDVIRSDRQR